MRLISHMSHQMRYSINTLAFAVAVSAIALSLWRQHRLRKTVDGLENRLMHVERVSKTHTRLTQVFDSLDTENSDDLEIFRHIQRLLPCDQLAPTLPLSPELVTLLESIGHYAKFHNVDADSNELEIMVLHHDSLSTPGSVTSVVALFRDKHLIDKFSHCSNTRLEHHAIELSDVNGDGMVDVNVCCTPGTWGHEGAKRTLNYLVTQQGFTKEHYGK